ncbi:MAG: hypothetical protein KAV87_51560, partial [Desulfobacteraceae bacterium]|nr:hypothetical protein [Desulfobacteraceae bacterium]
MAKVIAPAPKRLAAVVKDGDYMVLDRHMGNVDWSPNQMRKLDLKMQPNLLKNLKLTVEVQVTTLSVDLPINPDAPFSLINWIEVRASNGMLLKRIKGINLALMNHYEFRAPQMNGIPANLGSQGQLNFFFDILIPFENHTGLLPERTAVNTNEWNEITLKIYWADGVALAPAWEEADDDIDYVVCSVCSLEKLPPPGSPQEEVQIKQRMIDTEQAGNLAAGTNFIMPENTMLKTIGVVTRDSNGDRTDAAAGEMRLTHTNDQVTLRRMTWQQIQSQNKSYYNIEDLDVGFAIFELDKDHDFTELLNTRNRNFVRFHVDPADTP